MDFLKHLNGKSFSVRNCAEFLADKSVVGDAIIVIYQISESMKKPLKIKIKADFGVDVEPEQDFLVIENQNITQKSRFSFGDVIKIMDILRGENGCAWDKAQTHESIKQNCIEEANEVVAAIDSGDTNNLCEELGDLLLQTVFHSAIAKSAAEFDIHDVTTALCQKLIKRHTHVFGDDKAATAEDALALWKKNKQQKQ